MSGDPTNARLWTDADVYIALSLTEADPADVNTAFGGGWDLVGLLDGDDGFTEARDEDVNDHFAWGGILVRTSRAHFKLTKTFSALEDNDTTFALRWPGSTRGGDIIVPRPAQVKIAFETRDGDVIHRLISANYAEVTLNADVTENEPDLAKLEFLATIFPTGDDPAVLFVEQTTTGS
jgi:hypothetical protein